MKQLYTFSLFLVSCLLFTSNAKSQVCDLRFSSNLECESSVYCANVQITSQSDVFKIGTSSIFFYYNEKGLEFTDYNSKNFDGSSNCIADVAPAWLEQQAYTLEPGLVNITLTLTNNDYSCPEIDASAWIDVAEVCFNITDDTQTTGLLFSDENTNFNANDPNNGSSPINKGVFAALDESLSCTGADGTTDGTTDIVMDDSADFGTTDVVTDDSTTTGTADGTTTDGVLDTASTEGSSDGTTDSTADGTTDDGVLDTASTEGSTDGTNNCDNIIPVIISEINYNSPSTYDSGDWVEFYNPNSTAVDMANWVFADEAKQYTFPAGTTIDANSYLVLVTDEDKFNFAFPMVLNYVGPADLGFSNGGELLTLLNEVGCDIDMVEYDDASPWATEADGNGSSLNLIVTTADNSLAASWSASLTIGGTPGGPEVTPPSCDKPAAPSITASATEVCNDGSTSVTITADGLAPTGFTFEWVKDGGIKLAEQSATLTVIEGGVYQVNLVNTSDAECTSGFSNLLVINDIVCGTSDGTTDDSTTDGTSDGTADGGTGDGSTDGTTEQANVEVRFADNNTNCETSKFCTKIQLKSNNAEPFIVGTSSVYFNYSAAALAFTDYTPDVFHGDCPDGSSGWDLQQWDGLIDGNFNLTIRPIALGCNTITNEWLTLGEACFDIEDSSLSPNLDFRETHVSFNSYEPNNGTSAANLVASPNYDDATVLSCGGSTDCPALTNSNANPGGVCSGGSVELTYELQNNDGGTLVWYDADNNVVVDPANAIVTTTSCEGEFVSFTAVYTPANSNCAEVSITPNTVFVLPSPHDISFTNDGCTIAMNNVCDAYDITWSDSFGNVGTGTSYVANDNEAGTVAFSASMPGGFAGCGPVTHTEVFSCNLNTEGNADGTTDNSTDGTTDSTADGTTDSSTDGTTDSTADGTTDNSTDGTTDSTADGTTDNSTDGTTDNSTDDGIIVNPPVDCNDAQVCGGITICTEPMTPITICPEFDCLPGTMFGLEAVHSTYECGIVLSGSCFIYTPLPGIENFSPDYAAVTGYDEFGNCATLQIEVEIGTCNEAPVAANDNSTTNQDTPVTINVLPNDSDPDGDNLTICDFSQPLNGSVINNNGQFVYTPNVGFYGSDAFNYTICDGNGGTSTATVTVTVMQANQPPIANDDNSTTNEDTPVTINVLPNDNDPEGDNLTICDFTQPVNGSVVNTNGQFVYTPNTGFYGSDAFNYTICDGNGGTSTATVTITVIETVNQSPVANDDSFTIPADNPFTVPVTGNDIDPDGDNLTICEYTQPINGTLSLVNGELIYTPFAGFSGNDIFTYTICDEDGEQDTATVAISVEEPIDPCENPIACGPYAYCVTPMVSTDMCFDDCITNGEVISHNSLYGCGVQHLENGCIRYTPLPGMEEIGSDQVTLLVSNGTNCYEIVIDLEISNCGANTAPVAVDDYTSTEDDAPVTISVLPNDSDPDGDDIYVCGDYSQPINGTVVQQGNQFIYTPNAGFSGTDDFTYQICDGNGGSDYATVYINVTQTGCTNPQVEYCVGQLQPIVICPDFCALTGEDYELVNMHSIYGCSVSNLGDCIRYVSTPGFSGNDIVQIVACTNNQAVCDTVILSVQVGDCNTDNQPPHAVVDLVTAVNNQANIIAVLNNDSDSDGDAIEVCGFTQAGNGSVSQNGNQLIYTPNANYTGSDSFTYNVCDGNGGLASATVVIVVSNGTPAPTNNNPSASNDAATTDYETNVIISVLTNDSDSDNDNIEICSNSEAGNGSVTVNGNQIVYTPNAGFSGTDTFTYQICDGNGGTDVATVTITVSEEPVTCNVSSGTIITNDATTVCVGGSETVTVMPSNGVATNLTYIVTDGTGTTILGGPTTDATFSFAEAPAGTCQIWAVWYEDINIPNDQVASITGCFALSNPINVTREDCTPEPTECTATAGSLTAVEVSVCKNVAMIATVTNAPVVPTGYSTAYVLTSGSSLIIEQIAASPSFTTNVPGNYTIHTLVYDASILDVSSIAFGTTSGTDIFGLLIEGGGSICGALDVVGAGITVEDCTVSENTAPDAIDDNAATSTGTPVVITVLGNDVDSDGDAIIVCDITMPSNGTFQLFDNEITYTPNVGFTGTDTFTYTVCDGNEGQDVATVTIVVTAGNTTPTATDDTATTMADTAISLNLLSNDFDVDGDNLTICNNTMPSNGTLTSISNGFIYEPNTSFVGTDSFTYTVCDGNGGEATATASITVNEVVNTNNLPVANDDAVSITMGNDTIINVIANDFEPDGDNLTICDLGSPANGTATLAGNQIYYTPNAGFTGTEIFTYSICDGNGGEAMATITISVVPDSTGFEPTIQDLCTGIQESIDICVEFHTELAAIEGVPTTTFDCGITVLNETCFRYTPLPGFENIADVIYVEGCFEGSCVTVPVNIYVGDCEGTQVNNAPIAVDDTETTQQGESVEVSVLVNDTDEDGDVLEICDYTQPTNGVVDFTNGVFTYIPNALFTGNDNFSYTVCDGNGGSAIGLVSIIVNTLGNDCNQVIPSYCTTPIDIANPEKLLVCLEFCNQNAEIVELVSTYHCAVGVSKDDANCFEYAPLPLFTGDDYVQARACDAEGNCEILLVNITVAEDCGNGKLPDTQKLKKLGCELDIPNVLTPNGDGVNDQLKIEATNCFNEVNFTVDIFDAFGTLIQTMQVNDKYELWDGKNINGTIVPAGTYFYIIKPNGNNDLSKMRKGFIEVRK